MLQLLRVPVGKIIYLDYGMEHIIWDVDNVQHILDRDMGGKKWIMKEDGLSLYNEKDRREVADTVVVNKSIL